MSGDIKFLLWLLLLSSSSPCFGSELDVRCLMTVQQSVIDNNGMLGASWVFSSNDMDICNFAGVECWPEPHKNRILALHLNNMGLGGQFPRGLEDCYSLIGLDLSSNRFSGPIPSDISRQMPFLKSLNLSDNSFSGEIPAGIGNMWYLESLIPSTFSATNSVVEFHGSYNDGFGLQVLRVIQTYAGHRWVTAELIKGKGEGGGCPESMMSHVLAQLPGLLSVSWWPSTSRAYSSAPAGSAPTWFR